MSKLKRNVIVLSVCFVLSIVFLTSYFLSLRDLNKAKSNSKNQGTVIDNSVISTNVSKEVIINKDTKITFEVQYKKSGEVFPEKNDI